MYKTNQPDFILKHLFALTLEDMEATCLQAVRVSSTHWTSLQVNDSPECQNLNNIVFLYDTQAL